MRRTYELKVDDVERFGGAVILDRWSDGEIRILVCEGPDNVAGDKRANIVMSRDESKRLARQLVAMAARER